MCHVRVSPRHSDDRPSIARSTAAQRPHVVGVTPNTRAILSAHDSTTPDSDSRVWNICSRARRACTHLAINLTSAVTGRGAVHARTTHHFPRPLLDCKSTSTPLHAPRSKHRLQSHNQRPGDRGHHAPAGTRALRRPPQTLDAHATQSDTCLCAERAPADSTTTTTTTHGTTASLCCLCSSW